MPVPCKKDCGKNAVLKRPKTGDALCKECFFWAFESEIHYTITKAQLFNKGDSVAIAASGGKDSTVLAHVLKTLNQQYDYGLELMLLSIDEGITGYRDDSLETVKQNRDDYEMSLKILSYKDLYGWTMDEIVAQIGRKNNCTFCGVFRRQALDRGAAMLGVKCIATGHNADDIAETVLMNVLRGDIARLKRCTAITTTIASSQIAIYLYHYGNKSLYLDIPITRMKEHLQLFQLVEKVVGCLKLVEDNVKGSEGTIPRVKPLKYTYEKEIVMYAHYKKLVYFSTECVFAPNAYRGHARALLKDMEKIRPSCIMDIIYSGETMSVKEQVSLPTLRICSRCKFVSSQEVCKACVLLEGLNKGLPKLGIGKSSKAKRMLEEYHLKQIQNGTDILTDVISDLSDIQINRKSNKKNECNSNNNSTCNNKNKCCQSNDCRSKEYINGEDITSNKKLNILLAEYGLEGSNTSSNSIEKNDTNVSDDSDNETVYKEDDTCAGSCGKMGSLQIGF